MGKIHKNIVAQYKFEDVSNLGVDSSGNGNNGTNYGATSTDGVFGRGARFDGVNDCIDCMVIAEIIPISLSCWASINSAGNYALLTKLPNTTTNGNWSLRTTGGLLELFYKSDLAVTISTGITLTSTPSHIVVIMGSSNIKIYVNSVLVANQNTPLYNSSGVK